jgi:hypothetical protein
MRLQSFIALMVGLSAGMPGAASAGLAVFDDPMSVCEALAGEGLEAGQWRQDEEGFEGTEFTSYKCLSPGLAIAGGRNGPFVTSINYFAEGRTNDRVEIVKLVLNVHDRKTRDAGRAKFLAASKALLHALRIDPPPLLLTALEQSRAGVFAFDGGRIRFDVWTIPVERQRLTIESNAVIHR